MSKEIYKEYVNGRIDGLEDDSEYLFEGKPLHESEHFIHRRSFMLIPPMHHDKFTRKPKTQMINGHEVVAPRYDLPAQKTEMFYLDFAEKDGVINETYNELLHPYVHLFGWFDNKDDAIAYANAHRENKND